MKGDDFLGSDWVKRGNTEEGRAFVRETFSDWSKKVKNADLISKAKQLFEFFKSDKITGLEKALVTGALIYIISPIDLIPDFIPLAGWVDDIGVAAFALRYVFTKMGKNYSDSPPPLIR